MPAVTPEPSFSTLGGPKAHEIFGERFLQEVLRVGGIARHAERL
jgi:hypothetical protein